MRWPWVSRMALDLLGRLQNETARERDRLERQLDGARCRIDELTGEIIRMRREGFVPQPEPPRQEEAHPLPQGVLDAIEERATTGAIRRQLTVYAERRLRDGLDDKELAEIILTGEQFDEEFV